MKRLILASILVCSGCASITEIETEPWVDTITLPNGQKAISINCGGTFNTYSDCMRKAGEKCPGGYEILDKYTDSSHIESGSSSLSAYSNAGNGSLGGASGYTSGEIINRIMVVQCRNVKAKGG